VALGFLGLAVLLLPGARPDDVAGSAVATVVVAALLWSIGSFHATRTELPKDGLTTTALEMAAGSLGLLVVGTVRGERLDVTAVSTASWVALGYLVVFGSLVAFTAYAWLLAVAPVSQVSTYAYVNPVVAVALGAVLRDEQVTALTLVGGATTVVAVAVVVREEGGAAAGAAEARGSRGRLTAARRPCLGLGSGLPPWACPCLARALALCLPGLAVLPCVPWRALAGSLPCLAAPVVPRRGLARCCRASPRGRRPVARVRGRRRRRTGR
jgi:hypothetical protein